MSTLLHMLAIGIVATAAALGVAAVSAILLAWLATWRTLSLVAASALVLLVVGGIWLGAGG